MDTWIKAGYDSFALVGYRGLKIEPLSKKIGKNKSSFYHHFADLEFFIEHLLKHHIHQCHIISEKESKAQNINPQLINILVEHKIDLLFNRELRIHRDIKEFNRTLEESNNLIGAAFIKVWMRDLDIKISKTLINNIFSLSLENFFLQITNENINFNWLADYFKELNQTTKSIINGSV